MKLRQLEKWTDARRAHAARYDQLLAESGIRRATEAKGRKHVYHVYGVYHERRTQLQAALQVAGVHTGIHYPIPVHLQRAYADLGYKVGDLPVTERIASEQLSLPMFPELTDDQIGRVAKEVAAWTTKGR